MKEPIEELFKKSLEGHEMSYRPEAWAAMSSRLDVTSPVAVPRSYKRYYIAAAGIGIAAVASYFIFIHNANEPITQPQIVQNDTTKSESTSSESTTKNEITVDQSSTESTTSTNTATSSTRTFSNPIASSSQSTNGYTVENNANSGPNSTPITQSYTGKSGGIVDTHITDETLTQSDSKEMVIPVISDFCINEEIIIENTNNEVIMILAPNGEVTSIHPGKAVKYQPSTTGMHGIGFLENEDFYSESTFSVQDAPESDFSIDAINKFESGIPTTHVIAGSTNDTYIWKANGQTVNGHEADIHFYKKGQQTITLIVSNEACSSTSERSIYIDENYNLMAMTAFNPLGNDRRNMTFMPFALTERNVNFNMVIIDSKDGGVVYETSDSDQPWDGTDIRTGERERGIATYIWKVILYNPELNEPAEYIGTVTKL